MVNPIVENAERHFGGKIKKIAINMNEYDYNSVSSEDIDCIMAGDYGVKQTVNKNAEYFCSENRLVIWQDGLPVYENNNGVITRDAAALADSLV